jgi:hypothetical protein
MTERRQLERYEILEQIGRGGMAVVYLARQRDLDRLVALKELGAFHAADPSWSARFVRESRVAGSLTQANIVTVYDYFEAGDTPYIAMEYLPRGSLRPYVGRLTLAQIGGVLTDVLAALQHAERHGIVHRDLKPENLLVTDDGRVKIADFGIAKATSTAGIGIGSTVSGVAVGTPAYMAPEQALAQPVGPWTDLYAVGCIAYELCTGRRPFADTAEPFPLMIRHVNEPVPPARSVSVATPPELSDWIDSLVVKEPAKRAARAAEAAETLEEVLFECAGPRWRRESALPAIEPSSRARSRRGRPASTVSLAVLPAVTVPAGAHRPARRRRVTAIAASAGAAALALLFLGALLWPSGGEPPGEGLRGSLASARPVLTAGPLTVTLPSGWAPLDRPPSFPGLALDDVASARPPGEAAGTMSAGLAPASRTTRALLPAALTRDARVPEPATVDLGGLTAYRYDDISVAGDDRRLTVYAVATSAGIATIACIAPGATAASLAAACRSAAESLTIRGARSFPPGPQRGYATALSRAVRRLNAVQGRRPSAAERSFARAARDLRAVEVGPVVQHSHRRLLAGLRAGRTAHGAAAAAARRSRQAGYARARARVRAASGSIARALSELRAAGYRPPAFRPRPLPALEPPSAPTTGPAPPSVGPAPSVSAPPAVGPPPSVSAPPPATVAPAPTARPRSTPERPLPTPIPLEGD